MEIYKENQKEVDKEYDQEVTKEEEEKEEEEEEEEDEIKAQAQLWKQMYGFAETIMLRCAVQLGIPDIIHKKGPLTLAELASELQIVSNVINMERFQQTMRFLVHMNLFTLSEENKYSLTTASKLLLKDPKKKKRKSLASYVMLQTHPELFSIWGSFVESLASGGLSSGSCSRNPYWETKYGVNNLYSLIEKDADDVWNKLMMDAMMSYTRCMVQAVINGLKRDKVLEGVNSLVDVGGNTGDVSKAILDAFPYLKCTVLDLLHVIEAVPKGPRLDFVAGDMFDHIPSAEAVLLKSVLHNHEDDACIKLLNNCKEAIDATRGKVILVEIVIDTEYFQEFTSARLGMNIDMTLLTGGKERTKQEWADLFKKVGFSHHKIIPIMAMESLIIVYP